MSPESNSETLGPCPNERPIVLSTRLDQYGKPGSDNLMRSKQPFPPFLISSKIVLTMQDKI